ncbi:MAG: thiamine pyrophosphate-requiring protein [Chloroflexi bacterium]|nr:thiamine pyrophosphate-requiring protein [Chloroflexota bacterium]
MKYSGGETLVRVLKKQGVKAIFSSPGTEWAPVWEALAKLHAEGDQGLTYYNCRHEMLAVSAAIGYAERSGEMPAVLLHTSSGLLHAAMAIRGAYMDHAPVVICAGESVRFTEGEDPESGRGWQWLHSLSDVGGATRMVAPYVKWSQAITSRETLAGAVARACQIARMAPEGPVYFSVSKEYLQEEAEDTMPQIPFPQARVSPDPNDIDKIATLLIGSQNPMIITQKLGTDPEAVHKLVELAEALGAPVFESITQDAVNFPREHPMHAGFDVTQAIRDADVVLAVAAITPWNPQRTGPPAEAKIVFIDKQAPYPRFPYWNYRADLIVPTEPFAALEALVGKVKAKRLDPSVRSKRFDSWKAKHDQMLVSWDNHARQARQKRPIDSHWLCCAINEWLPPDAIVVEETITHKLSISRFLRRVKPGNFIMGHAGGLGTGMGVALGAKVASPDRPVVHLVGDGSFNYNPVLSAFGFSQEYQAPVLTVVFNNGAYRAMQSAHLRLYPEGWASRTRTFYGVDIAPNPDYAQLAKAFDAYGEKVEDPDEIQHALGRAWAEIQRGRAALLDVVLDPQDPRV